MRNADYYYYATQLFKLPVIGVAQVLLIVQSNYKSVQACLSPVSLCSTQPGEAGFRLPILASGVHEGSLGDHHQGEGSQGESCFSSVTSASAYRGTLIIALVCNPERLQRLGDWESVINVW